ncbi:streptogramin lyase [Marmoricola sp. OAE513]|uniref:ScyD/ScyE family protein n=1 Tax=Marmoricola sp. OAE513 TaxID=2817894 RepID=UPI001AE19E2A
MSRTARPVRTPARPVGRAGVAALAALTLAGSAVATGTANAADPTPKPRPGHVLASGLFSPLSIEVAADGTRYYSQNFAGSLHRQKPGKKAKVVYRSTGGVEVGAVSVRRGTVRFALSGEGTTTLMELRKGGKAKKIADLAAYEKTRNPDRGVHYGFTGLPAECAAQFPAEGMPPSYTGIVEAHPYATAQVAGGTTYVADAAANAILAVKPSGKVRTVAVLPPSTLKITADFAERSEWPACSVGRTYRFEAVPTDVEVGPRGRLYVSTLPGGPEDGSLGAAASVYRINPKTGAVRKVVGGLVSATGLAVSPRGNVYVAELFGNRVVRILRGSSTPTTFVRTPMPGDVAWHDGRLLVTNQVLTGLSGQPGDEPAGQVVRYRTH